MMSDSNFSELQIDGHGVPEPPKHQTAEEFRVAGYATIDWLADFLAVSLIGR